MSVTATYTQVTSTTNTWIGTFQIGGVYYAIKDPNQLYRIETNGTQTYLRTVSGDVWGAVECDGTYIYRANSTTILKVNPADGSVPYSSACSGLRCLGIDTAGSRIFGLTNAGALYVFTLNNMTQYYVNNLGAATYGPKMVYLNGALYIPVYGGQIKKYVVDTGVVSTLTLTSSSGWLTISTDGTYLYASVDGGRIYRVDPANSNAQEELLGDSAGRYWYSNTYYNGQLWNAAYNGHAYKIALPIPAVPTASPTTSTIYTDTSVTLSCATSGATIKYTTNGTTPSATNGTTYSAPFTVSATTTIKFCAIKDGYLTAGADVVLTWGRVNSFTYNSGTWKQTKSLYVRNNSTWKLANKAYQIKNGQWTQIY